MLIQSSRKVFPTKILSYGQQIQIILKTDVDDGIEIGPHIGCQSSLDQTNISKILAFNFLIDSPRPFSLSFSLFNNAFDFDVL